MAFSLRTEAFLLFIFGSLDGFDSPRAQMKALAGAITETSCSVVA